MRYKSAGLAHNTVLSYARDWRVFTSWTDAAGRSALPASPETVELYVCDLLRLGRKVTTLERHAAGIQYHHRIAGYESPCGPELRTLLCGARRSLGQEPDQKDAIATGELRRMVEAIDAKTPIGARDRALLLFGFASALRRSNLAALERRDLTFHSRGIQVWIAHEKQDREGRGRKLAVPHGEHESTCPVRAVRSWLRYRGDGSGPLFQGVLNGRVTGRGILPNRIGQIVQEAVARIGLDRRRYAAHSLRAGFATEALTGGANEIMVAQQTGHRSLETLRTYLRSRDPFRGNAGAKVGL
jgi:integrase